MHYSGVSRSSLFVEERAQQSSEQIPNPPYALVVDDDEEIISVLLFLLESEGYTGVGITDSQQVLPFLQGLHARHMPAVILLDLMMSGLSGYEIAAWLSQSEQYRHIPIIIMTADSRVAAASVVEGATDLVTKPFHLITLLTKLQSYLGTSPS